MKIVNEECDYIIKNLDAVLALEESFERTQERVPTWIQRKLYDILCREVTKIDSYDKMQWTTERDDDQIHVCPSNKYYDPELSMGVYFGISSFNWDEICPNDRDDGMWFYLGYELPETRQKQKKYNAIAWETDQFSAVQSAIANFDKSFDLLLDKEEEILIVFYLNKILNIKALANNPEEMLENTIKTLLTFIENTHGIIRPLPHK